MHVDGKEARGYRVDVEATTDAGEIIVVEVQLQDFRLINERLLLYCQSNFASIPKVDERLIDALKRLPRIIGLTILDFTLYGTGSDFHQIGELVYWKEPRNRITDRFQIHRLVPPKFRISKPNFKNSLHCWLTAICKAQEGKASLKEIVEMDVNLKKLYSGAQGFAQFVDHYNLVASDPETREQYKRWQTERMVMAAEQEIRRAEHRAEGRAENQIEIALKAFSYAKSAADLPEIEMTLEKFGVPKDVIKSACERVKAKWDEKR
jgi:predicted transposase/invertase (TIGR01784 family)